MMLLFNLLRLFFTPAWALITVICCNEQMKERLSRRLFYLFCPEENECKMLLSTSWLKANKQFQRCIKDKISQRFSFFPLRESEYKLKKKLLENTVRKDSYLVKHGITGKSSTKVLIILIISYKHNNNTHVITHIILSFILI